VENDLMSDPIPAKDEIARNYGFATYAELLDISDPLPLLPGETVRSYVARRPDGTWFVWEDTDPPAVNPSN
jgi:hypothetical protein